MSQVYYQSQTTTSTSKPLVNGHLPLGSSSSAPSVQLPSPASLHQQATRAFLGRDFVQSALCLDLARERTPSSAVDEWFRLLEAGEEHSDRGRELAIERKLGVLELTLIATAHPSANPTAPSPDAYPQHFQHLLEIAPKPLLESLWASLLTPSPDVTPAGEIFASAGAEFVHPSLVTALTLAALKLNEPKVARSIAESWFGSVSPELDDFLASAGTRIGLAEFPIAGQGSVGASQVLARPGEKPELGQQLIGSWVKLLDVLSLHVLPRLGEWEAAGDVVRMQAVENGGWVPQDRIEASLRQIEHVRQEQLRAEEARHLREREQEAAKAAAATRSSSKRREKTKPNGIANGHAHEGSSTPPVNGRPAGSRSTSTSSRASHTRSPPKVTSPRLSQAPTTHAATPDSYSGMRSALSRYLGRSSQEGSQSGVQRRGTLATLAAKLQARYAADPVKLLAFVCFAFAFVTWVKRTLLARRAQGLKGLGVGEGVVGLLASVGAKVVETVRMGTKVTTL